MVTLLLKATFKKLKLSNIKKNTSANKIQKELSRLFLYYQSLGIPDGREVKGKKGFNRKRGLC